MKVKCHPKPKSCGWKNSRATHGQFVACWPFYNNGPLKLTHRVRYGTMHFWDGVLRHISFGFYCGNTGFISSDKPGRLLETVDKCAVLCATCEYKAVLRGEMSAEELLGFYPRFHCPIPRPPKPLPILVFNPS